MSKIKKTFEYDKEYREKKKKKKEESKEENTIRKLKNLKFRD